MNEMFILPSDFWLHFFEHYWDKRPFVIKQPFVSPIVSSEDILSGLKNAHNQFRASNPETRARFSTEDRFSAENAELKHYLPDNTDTSVVDYFQRINQKLKGRRFNLILNNFQVYSGLLWYRTREFLRDLLTRMPLLAANAVLLLGNYEKTPQGIHSDELSIFMFVIYGRKKIYLWPAGYFRDQFDEQRDLDFESLLKDAISLEGEVGDVLYWPSSYWHVGESVGGLSISVGLGLRTFHPGQEVWDHLRSNIEGSVNRALEDGASAPFNELGNNETISKVFKLAMKALRSTAGDPTFELNLEVSRLNRLTAGGFKKVPPPLPWKSLADSDTIQVCRDYPIVWRPTAEHQIVCSANGHSFSIPADPQVIKMLERLNSGESLLVKDLIEENAGMREWDGVEFVADPEGIRALLSKLYTLLRVI